MVASFSVSLKTSDASPEQVALKKKKLVMENESCLQGKYPLSQIGNKNHCTADLWTSGAF